MTRTRALIGLRAGAVVRAGRLTGAFLALLLGLLASTTGCGLPRDDRPREISSEAIPPGLLAPSSTAVPTDAPPGHVEVDLYFMRESRLSRVERETSGSAPTAVLTALLRGPDQADGNNLRSAIPAGTGLLGVDLRDDGTLVVNLSSGILAVQGVQQKYAFAQIVYTATALDGVSGVRFEVDSQRAQALTDDGTQAGPVGRWDFRSLAPSG